MSQGEGWWGSKVAASMYPGQPRHPVDPRTVSLWCWWWGGVEKGKFMIIYQVNTLEVTKEYIFQYLDHICPTIFFVGQL